MPKIISEKVFQLVCKRGRHAIYVCDQPAKIGHVSQITPSYNFANICRLQYS